MTVLILGGGGFIGRALTEKYLHEGWKVIISTRLPNITKIRNKLISHNFDISKFNKYISNSQLLFITKADFSNPKWKDVQSWQETFKKIGISLYEISRMINLVANTSGSAKEILKSNLGTLDGMLTVVKKLKAQNNFFIFCNMGSTVEKRFEKKLPPYEKTKKIARQKLEESGLCDYQFIAAYVKGKGEQKMTQAAWSLWKKMRICHRWFYGFKISIIDVDDLADIIYYILEEFLVPSSIKINKLPIEVNITNGELIFGEMVRNLLPKKLQVIPRPIIPCWLEKYFLKIYALIIPILKSRNQASRRLANFAKRSLMEANQQKKIFKSVEEIKNLSLKNNYIVLKKEATLIVVDKNRPIIYILREKSQKELIQIIQKSVH